MQKKVENRGGKRENSGRKKAENPKSVNIVFRVTEDESEKLRKKAEKYGSIGDYFRARGVL